MRAIDIAMFVEADRDSHGVNFVKQVYYLEPEPVGRKAFYLLKQVLAEEGLQAICKIVLKDREALAALSPYSRTMLLSTLYWPDEVRAIDELELPEEQFEFKPAERAMAEQLVATMKGEFRADDYRDDYRQALLDVIQSKIDGQPATKPEPMVAPTKLTDLMAVLEASVAAARASKGGKEAAGGAAAGGAAAGTGTRRTAARSKAKAAEAPAPIAAARSSRGGNGAAAPKRATKAAGSVEQPSPAARKPAAAAERKRKSA